MMVVHLSVLISPLASVFLFASVTCLLLSPLPSSLLFRIFPFVVLFHCCPSWCLSSSSTPGSRSLPPSLPPSLFLFVGLPPPKRSSRKDARFHTQGTTHRHATYFTHTQTETHARRVARSHSHTHPYTRSHTRTNTHTNLKDAKARTNARTLRTRTAGHAHTCYVLACLSCASSNPACTSECGVLVVRVGVS